MNREELKKKLRQKLSASKMKRSTKQVQNMVYEKEFKKQGVDLDKLKEDIEAVRKQGGLTLNLKKDEN